MFNSVEFVKGFICDEEGAKGYADLKAYSRYKLSKKEQEKLAKRYYEELVSDMNELRKKGIM